MSQLFKRLNAKGHLDGLEFSPDEILEELGFGEINEDYSFEAYDLTAQVSALQFYEVANRTWRFAEYASQMLAAAKHKKNEIMAEQNNLYNSALKEHRNLKPTEAKAVAKASPRYMELESASASVEAWYDYIGRFYDQLKMLHYLMKDRAGVAANEEKKGNFINAHS